MAKYCKTRKAAKKLGRLYYKTGEACFRGHNAPRFTSTGKCVECDKLYKVSRRNAIKLATPPWADLGKIQELYDECFDKGPDYHVDHNIPLQGDLVCGLHTHDNLRILHGSVNMSKSNRYEVE